MVRLSSAGVLLVADTDTVTATYIDADDGQGGLNVTVTATVTVDCSPPVISTVQTINIQARSATVTFNTDEPANGTVRYGSACGALTDGNDPDCVCGVRGDPCTTGADCCSGNRKRNGTCR